MNHWRTVAIGNGRTFVNQVTECRNLLEAAPSVNIRLIQLCNNNGIHSRNHLSANALSTSHVLPVPMEAPTPSTNRNTILQTRRTLSEPLGLLESSIMIFTNHRPYIGPRQVYRTSHLTSMTPSDKHVPSSIVLLPSLQYISCEVTILGSCSR